MFMLICFQVPKSQSDPPNDPHFPPGSPVIDTHPSIKLDHIYNDRDYYWWLSDLPFTPQLGWVIHTPNMPCELRDYGAPVTIVHIECWPVYGHLYITCN